jgi:hypothetical protein
MSDTTGQTVLELIPDFLRSLALLGPVLPTAAWVLPVLNTVALLVERGESGARELAALTDQMRQMVDAGRAPTPAEFNALRARSDAAHAALQAQSNG